MRTSSGAPVTLLFDGSGVHVLHAANWGRRLFRIAGGAVFAAVALAALGLGVGHAVKPLLGTALAVAAPALAAAAGIAAVTAWAQNARLERAHRHDRAEPDIAIDLVAWARSSQHDGRVHVVVGMADGSNHEFIAGGATGMQLAHRFGELLATEQHPRVADSAADDTDQR